MAPVTILGISAYYHDSAAALLRDGEIIAAASEERFTRRKGDATFPAHAVAYCLHEGGTRMGDDPSTSVVNRYGQTWDIPNLFLVGSSTFPTMSGFNPTLTIQALAYMTAEAIVNRYRNNPGPLV